MTERSTDTAIVGAGILGLAHAYIAAKSGKKVTVFERHPAASGASIANFGLLWPIGQTAGRMFDLAMKSRYQWLEILQAARIPYKDTGSLHVACRKEEAAVGQEFAELGPTLGYQCAWLSRDETLARSPAVQPAAVVGALWSGTEIMVDPREVLRKIPEFLAEQYGVQFHWNCPVHSVERSRIVTSRRTWQAERVIVCNGTDFETLFPDFFAQSGLVRCRLQMMRTGPQPQNWNLGPAIAGGLTFRFYPSFRICRSLDALRAYIAQQMPEYDRFGIHTMVSQASSGGLTFGDSHEYGLAPTPFNRDCIDAMILRHLETFLQVPDRSIAERWYGVYAKHPEEPWVRYQPEDGVDVITGLGGAGMTLSFGVALETLEALC
ncbi:TIGR03364 family FAD-dependent oxidoreductase [Paracidobacterium acidisoli]|uniref:TIGR03364 family FAD-dependent oxidoreductase n=1 Tax=Paracidobacterium acidisoli TaxID=2303751 RepID=A0A372IMC9_9BACT|nr:TIGR03364 family FAD-dependent oxidoreductase [Paracidobacterium acidisoli]